MYGVRANLRMVIVGPVRQSGGMMALTREPSARRASTIGLDSSTRRPIGARMRRMTASTWSLLVNCFSVSTILPWRST